MALSFLRSNKGKVVVILDIGSGSIGGAIVSYDGDKKPKILFSVRESIVFQNEFKFERFLSSMLSATEKVLKKISDSKKGKPKKIFCILAAPWYVSQAKTAVFKDEKTFIVTEKRVSKIIAHEVNTLKKNFDAHYKDLTESKAEIIEVKNIHMKLNGYETSMPYGKKAKRLEASLYISMSAGQVLHALREKIQKILSLNDVVFNSFSLAAFDTIRDIYSEKQNFIFIDIGGEMTDISVTRDGTLVDTLSFPLGKNFLIRTLASELQTVPEEALSMFGLYVKNKTTNTSRRKMLSALEHIEEEWSRAFYKTLESLSARTTLPCFLFVIADVPFGKWFTQIIEHKGSGGIMLMGESIDIALINPVVLSKFAVFDNKTMKDAFIITESLFVGRLIKSET